MIIMPKKRHPHAYTLALLRLAVDRLPPTFSAEKKREYERELVRFEENGGVSYDEIQRTIVSLGKGSWAFRKAYEEMYARYGRSSEEAHLLENLDHGIREKYERFIHEGGKINYIESAKSLEDLAVPSPFERYFTPEEKFAVEQALLAAREAARKEIDELVLGKKKEEYAALVESYLGTQAVMEKKIDELKGLAGVSEKWEAEISDRVRTIEEGWSVVEQGLDAGMLEKEMEYWRGTLQSFLHA